jgi:hypothetical protein
MGENQEKARGDRTRMKWKHLNPVTWVSGGLTKIMESMTPNQNQGQPAPQGNQQNQGTPQGANVPVPVPTTSSVTVTPDDDQGKPAVPVEGQFITRQEQDARMLSIVTAAAQKTEQFRREAESFDDEKAPGGEKALRVVFSTFCYVVPSVLAVVVGLAVGDAFTPANATVFYTWYAHLLSVALEASLPIMGLVSALTFRRAFKDRSQIAVCAVAILIFLALGIGNAVVQIFMVTRNIGALNDSDKAAVVFRACAPLIVDTICSFYLAVTGAKSLKRYLADKRAVIEAVRDISGINILLESQQQTAALNEMQAMMDMQSKQKRAETWNKIEALQAEKMVRQAEKAMDDDDTDGGYYRRRRY